MIERFRQLAPREQLILIVGTLLAVLIIGWQFVWSPLRENAGELNLANAERSRQIVDLRRAAGLSSTSMPGIGASDDPNLIFLVDETASPLGLTTSFTRTSPDGADAINISFTDARFDRLLQWLIDLEQNYGVSVVTTSFSRTRSTGLVSGTVRLDRS